LSASDANLVVAYNLERPHMLDHVSITVTNIGAAEKFYDAIMGALGVPKVRKSELRLGYGERCDGDHPDRNYLSIKSGSRSDDAPARHWCFKAPSRAAVDAFWKAGMANGGADNGPPGIRDIYHASYYAAFLIDPSGNRVEAVCHLRAG
jgi:catechol 2,3-dioxygenase-like lactoylglutathione lyase family enzyme